MLRQASRLSRALPLGIAPKRTFARVASYAPIVPSDSLVDVASKMKANGQPRAYILFDNEKNTFEMSHPMLKELAISIIEDERDFANHEAVFLEAGAETGALHSVFLHNTTRGLAFGGVRATHYRALEDYAKDGLRLSASMGHKNALAGIWWGGGGSLIALPDPRHAAPDREALFREHGRFVTSLQGSYVTGRDLGVTLEDMAVVHECTRFSVNTPRAVGGSGDPSDTTGRGVVLAMQAAVELEGGSLAGKSLAVMGAGRVARAVIAAALDAGVQRAVVADPSQAACDELRALFTDGRVEVRHVHATDLSILTEDVDILSPCATGGVLNPLTIPAVRAHIVCGPAHSQLLDPLRDATLLQQRGIVFVPDYITSRMGAMVSTVETAGSMVNDPLILRHLDRAYPRGIYAMTQAVLSRAEKDGTTPAHAARAVAGELLQQPHPILPNRARNIVQSLVQHGWVNNW